jgi:hypothetical protein
MEWGLAMLNCSCDDQKAQRCKEKQWEMASYNKSEAYRQLSLEIPAVMNTRWEFDWQLWANE